MEDDLEHIHKTLHSKHWSWEIHGRSPGRLMELLKEKLPHIEPSSWPLRFEWGGIFVNGRPAISDFPLRAPCKVEYFEPKHSFEDMERLYPVFKPEEHVIYEDEDLLAVYKPAGLPSKPSKEQRKFSLLASLERYAGRKLHMPSRLDAGTAGLIIVSKTKRAHAGLQKVFENHHVRKQYLLEVKGRPDWKQQQVDAAIGRDSRHPVLRKVVPDGGKTASTRFKVLSTCKRIIDNREEEFSLLSALPLTGRTHQIRVHSVHLGFPLVGDCFYGGFPAPELHLLSFRLRIDHPATSAPLRLELPERLLPEWVDKDAI